MDTYMDTYTDRQNYHGCLAEPNLNGTALAGTEELISRKNMAVTDPGRAFRLHFRISAKMFFGREIQE